MVNLDLTWIYKSERLFVSDCGTFIVSARLGEKRWRLRGLSSTVMVVGIYPTLAAAQQGAEESLYWGGLEFIVKEEAQQ